MNFLMVSKDGINLESPEQINDVIGAAWGADGLILVANDLPPTFFDLSTGFAGALFQKLINYQLRSVLVLPDFNAYGLRFSELAYEHQTHRQIRFVKTMDEAVAWLNS